MMKSEELIEKVKHLMEELEIVDEDVKQDIYLNALESLKNDDKRYDDVDIVLEIINPVIYRYFKEIAMRKRNLPLSILNKEGLVINIYCSHPSTILQLRHIRDEIDNLEISHPSMINEYISDNIDIFDANPGEADSILNRILPDILQTLDLD